LQQRYATVQQGRIIDKEEEYAKRIGRMLRLYPADPRRSAMSAAPANAAAPARQSTRSVFFLQRRCFMVVADAAQLWFCRACMQNAYREAVSR